MDSKGMFNLAKLNEWCVIEDLAIFATLANDCGSCMELDPRLQRHFVTINVPPLKGQSLNAIVTMWAEVSIVHWQCQPNPPRLDIPEPYCDDWLLFVPL